MCADLIYHLIWTICLLKSYIWIDRTMDLIDKLRELAKTLKTISSQINTEEATKNALIMPFIQSLGYNVFNPLEVIPEYTSDHGVKQGEKVDYLIKKDGESAILIECKKLGSDLDLSQGVTPI